MERTNNIMYTFQGENVSLDNFIRLLCESIKTILSKETEAKE